jgi:pimeloyl-ACP methyl ester carboxylesterase
MKIKSLNFNVKISGKGFPFIWAHGLMSSVASENALDFFKWGAFPADRQLIRYDARGHGESDPSFLPGDYHWKQLAKDMIAVADGSGVTEFIAGGQSMGCATSVYAGLLFPEQVKGLVLVNPPTAWESRAAQGRLYNKMAKTGGLLGGKILARIMGRKMERLLPGWLVDSQKENVNGALEGLRSLKRKTLLNLFKGAALTDFPPKQDIPKIDMPSLILAWVDDASHPIETAMELEKRLPQSELVIAEGFSDFEKWPGLIREFVSGLP